MTLQRSEAASEFLLNDLRSDVAMEWLPEEMWLSYLSLDSAAAELDYDLAISATEGVAADFADTGVPAPESIPLVDGGRPAWPVLAGIGAGLVTLGVGLVWARRGRLEMSTGRPA